MFKILSSLYIGCLINTYFVASSGTEYNISDSIVGIIISSICGFLTILLALLLAILCWYRKILEKKNLSRDSNKYLTSPKKQSRSNTLNVKNYEFDNFTDSDEKPPSTISGSDLTSQDIIQEVRPKPNVILRQESFKRTPLDKQKDVNMNLFTMEKAEKIAKNLHRIIKGLGSDQVALIKEIVKQKNYQRQLIKDKYMALYNTRLEDDIKSETRGNFSKCLCALLKPIDEFEAECLMEALEKNNHNVLVQIICSKEAHEIEVLNAAFSRIYKKNLAEEISQKSSHGFGRMLRAILSANRSDLPTDYCLAEKEASILYDEAEGRLLDSESQFSDILCLSSFKHLKVIFEEFDKKSKDSIEKLIIRQMEGNFRDACLAIVKSAKSKARYFAEMLHQALDAPQTDDDSLIRILICRSEIDLEDIKANYLKMYKKTLYSHTKAETIGEYKKLLLALIEQNFSAEIIPAMDNSSARFKIANRSSYRLAENNRGYVTELPVSSHQSNMQTQITGSKLLTATQIEKIAERIHKAISKSGSGKDALTKEILRYNNYQRQLIKDKYQTLYNQVLEDQIQLNSSYSDNFKMSMYALLQPTDDFEAKLIRGAMQTNNNKILTQIICSKEHYEINALKESFQKLFNQDLQSEIAQNISGDFGKILSTILSGNRSDMPADASTVARGSDILREEFINTPMLIELFCMRSFKQLYAIFDDYEKSSLEYGIAQTIINLFSGDERDALLAIVKSVWSKSDYFAELIHEDLIALEMNPTDLVRLLVSRSEIDLDEIKHSYTRMYRRSLYAHVKSRTNGDFKKLILSLIEA